MEVYFNTVINYRQKATDWSDLPKELVIDIATRLTRIEDCSRFLAVCHHWRSSVPSLNTKPNLLAPPSQILTTIAVFLVQPLDSSPSKGWIATFAQLDNGKLRLLHPLSRIPNKQNLIYNATSKPLDLRYFNVTLIAQSFVVMDWYRYSRKMLSNALKLQVVHCYRINFIDDGGGGGNTLTMLLKQGSLYAFLLTPMNIRVGAIILDDCDDIIVFKGVTYGLDINGKAHSIVATINEDNHSVSIPIFKGFTGTWRRRLVESDGDLYLVSPAYSSLKSGWFRVYKLNEDQCRWDEISSLGDRTLFMSHDFSFFVSARELQGCKPNRIIYQSNCFDRPGGKRIPEDDPASKRLQIGVLLPKYNSLSRHMPIDKCKWLQLQSDLTWFPGAVNSFCK